MIPIFFYISLSTYICYQILKYRKSLIILENKKYNPKEYWKYIKENPKEIFLTKELLAIILIIISVNADAKITGISAVILYMILSLNLIRKKEGKLKITKALAPIIAFIIVFYIIIITLCSIDYYNAQNAFLIFDRTWIYYIAMVLISYFEDIILLIFTYLTKPFRKQKKHSKKPKTT